MCSCGITEHDMWWKCELLHCVNIGSTRTVNEAASQCSLGLSFHFRVWWIHSSTNLQLSCFVFWWTVQKVDSKAVAVAANTTVTGEGSNSLRHHWVILDSLFDKLMSITQLSCPALGRGTPCPLFPTLVHSPPHLLLFLLFPFPFLVHFTYFLLSSIPCPFLPE